MQRSKTKDKGRLRKEGFWTNTSAYGYYPSKNDVLPIPNDESWDEQNVFLNKLRCLEESLLSQYQAYVDTCNSGNRTFKNPGHVIEYRGFSVCRICGCANGSREFRRYGWTWPQGLRHYVEEHNVKPSNEFVEFILSFNTDKVMT